MMITWLVNRLYNKINLENYVFNESHHQVYMEDGFELSILLWLSVKKSKRDVWQTRAGL